MHFESFEAFLRMGGHALYVWLAYGATGAVLVGYALYLRGKFRRLTREIRWLSPEDSRAVTSKDA